MRKYLFSAISLFIALSILPLTTAAPVKEDKPSRGSDKRPAFVSDEIIIKFKKGFDLTSSDLDNFVVANYKKLAHRTNKHIKKHGIDRLYLLQVKDLRKTIKRLRQHPQVDYAEPNYIVHTLSIPNDPDFSLLYGLNNTGQTGGTPDADIDAPEAWDIQTGSSSVVVAVIDTGVDYNHEDLALNIWTNPNGEVPDNGIDDDGNGYVDDVRGWDFYNNDNDPIDDHGHGTHCAGTIGGVGNNGIGVVGVNWDVEIMPLKFLSSGGSGTTAGAISAIQYATLMGANVMSNSWGGGGYSQALKDTIAAAGDAGILFVAAAGNSGANSDQSPMYPAAYDNANIVSVAATDYNDQKASFSNYGVVSVDLGAPGVNIYSTVPPGPCSLCDLSGFRFLSGTSMATPHVSGVAGLIKAEFPALTANGLKLRLLGTIDPIPSLDGITVTGGRLNAYNSLEVDNIPPSPVFLATDSSTFSSVTLTWITTGDDGNSGTAGSYDVRYSTSPINTAADWEAATKATGESRPQPSGSTESFTVTGLSYSTTYYIGLEVFDNVGNPSGLSNIVSGTTTTPTVAYEDYMENGVNGWTSDGLWHQETARSSSPQTSWSYNNGAPDYTFDVGDNWGGLISPVIDLSAYSSAVLSFKYWYETESSSTYYDQRWIQIGVDGVFTNVAQLSGDPMWTWNEYSFDLSPYAGNSNVQVRFFFDTVDSILNNYEGWYIDDVMVLGESTEPNNPPVANAGESYTGMEDVALTFDGSGSYDSDGDPLTYSWYFGDGSTGTGVNPSHVYTAGGIYTVTLTVNDGKTDSPPHSTTATIDDVNDLPIADAGGPYTGEKDSAVIFDGSGSYDFDGDSLTYSWYFGDGTTGTSVNPTHAYTAGGTYTVTLTVNDGKTDSPLDTTTANITVASTDVVNITKAEYNSMKSQLKVEAISSANGAANLWAEGMKMTYNPKRGKYSLVTSYSPTPPTVTVTSDLGGTDAKTVAVKGTGKGKKK